LPIEGNQKIRNKIRREEVPASCPSDTQQPVTRRARERKPQSPKKETDPRISHLITYFCTEYERRLNCKYTVSGAKDGATFKALLKDHSEETLQQCVVLFMDDNERWLDGKRSIGLFRSRINQYMQQLARAAVDDEAWKYPRIE